MKKLLAALIAVLGFSVSAHATTWYVASNGSDANSCAAAQSISTPKLTITAALACVGAAGTEDGAGDTVQVAAGSYSATGNSDIQDLIPSGSDENNRFTLKCVTDFACTITMPSTVSWLLFSTATHYVTIQGFTTIDGKGSSTSSFVDNTFHHISFINNEMKDGIDFFGILSASGAADILIKGNIIHNVGQCPTFHGGCHGVYAASNTQRWTIEDNQIYDTHGYGIHIYSEDPDEAKLPQDFIIRRNILYDNGDYGTNGSGVIVYGDGHQIYNNIMYSNAYYGVLVRASGTLIAFNSIYGNTDGGILNQGVTLTCRNNIAFGNGGTQIQGCNTSSNNLTTDPLWVNVASSDYHLLAGSGAIGAGLTIGGITTDFDGVTRSSPPDIGAYQYAAPAGGVETFYVAKTGSDSYTCTQAKTSTTPRLTIAGGIGCVGASDTLIIGDGTYVEGLEDVVPSGISGAPTIIKAANAGLAVLRPVTLTDRFVILLNGKSYITFDGIVSDGAVADLTSTFDVVPFGCFYSPCSNVIFKNGVASHGRGDYGAGIYAYGSNMQILNTDVDSNNWHGIAVGDSGPGASNIIDGNRVSNSGGYGISLYAAAETGVSNNQLSNNIVSGGHGFGSILLSSGTGNLAYNNIVYENDQNGFVVDYSASANLIYFNTIYDNGATCVRLQEGASHIVRNNICWSNLSDTVTLAGGTGTVSNNVLGVNPLFINIAVDDFRLTTGSPAINAGVAVSGLTLDIDGNVRSNPPDIGAHEYAGVGNYIAANCGFSAFLTAKTAAEASTEANIVLGLPGCAVGVPWTSAVTITVPATAATFVFKGAGNPNITGGNDQTVIVDNYKPGGDSTTASALITILPNTTGTFRMYGITIQGGTPANSNYKQAMVTVGGTNHGFRMDHMRFNLVSSVYPAFNFATPTGVEFFGYVTGVLDHNIFNYSDRGGAFIVHFNSYGGGTEGDQSWSAATGLGTSDFLFFEDNTITNFGHGAVANDCYRGGKFVVRFNNIQGGGFAQTHPTGGSGRWRGCRGWEAYRNNITVGGDGQSNFNGFFMSSGTGVVWGNTAADQALQNFVSIHSSRRNNTSYTQTATPNGWGYAGTSFNGTGSNWDQNTVAATGFRPMDQPGNGVGDLLTGFFPNVTNSATGCISSAACAWPRQALEPVYEWLNTWSCFQCGGQHWLVYETDVLIANSTYYLYTASFTGASGVGAGVLASRPATCTAGVSYWATDVGDWNAGLNPSYTGQGSMYKCTATNTWTLYYEPYIYPHPLVTNTPVTPAISSITPNTGVQGKTGLSVAVTGSFTEWANGSTAASLSGSGITVNSTTVVSPLSATLSLDIAIGATLGNRDLLMTTGAVVETASNGFTVLPPGTISTVTPSTGAQGATVSLAVVGSGTSWSNGVTVASFSGSGLTVNSTTVTSATAATLSVTISAGAALTARNLSMTTGSLVETKTNALTVTAMPIISAISPNTGAQGDTNLAVTVTGTATSWVNGSTVASFSGTGITVNSTTVASSTSATLDITIGGAATVGNRNLLMTTSAVVETATNGFTVTASPVVGTITSVTPNSGVQGASPSLTIVGSGTSWSNGVTVASFSGSGITVNSTTVTSGTGATVAITIAAGATLSVRNFTMTTDATVETKLNAFTVTEAPNITTVSPNSGVQGDVALAVTVTGSATAWSNGVTVASFSGSGITVNSTTVASATSATLSLDISPTATAGLRNLLMTTGVVVETETNGFAVTAAPVPGTITSVNPPSSLQATSVALSLVGSGTSWSNGVTVATFNGTGITVDSTTVASTTAATVNITIASNATVGSRNLTMTTGALVETKVNGFTVVETPPEPFPTQVTFISQPVSAITGQSIGTVTVALQDSGDVTVPSATSVVTLIKCAGSPAGTLVPAAPSVAAVAGVATFSGLVINAGSGSDYTLCASSPGLTSDVSSSFNITPPDIPAPTPDPGVSLPFVQQQYFSGPGLPNRGGFICTYQAGTTLPLPTYSDVVLSNANQNPVRLSSTSGRPVFNGSEIQLNMKAQAYKVVIYGPGIGNNCNGTQVGATISTRDHITGYNILNATDFSITGDATASSQLISTAAAGNPPFKVKSTTPVDNLTLNAEAYSAAGVQQNGVKYVTGTATLAAGTATVTLTGSAVFTSNLTYYCTANDETAAEHVKITRTNGSSITFTGTSTDVIAYACIGR